MENTSHDEKGATGEPLDENSDKAANPETPTPESSSPAPDQDLAKCRDELAESKDKYIRLYSEFENFRRRTAKERIDLIQTATSQLIKELLPVLDDFERVEKAFGDQPGRDGEGFRLSLNKFRKTLEAQGLKPMEALDKQFDADMHEAITQIPNPEKVGKVLDVVEKGYLLHDKVIRYAKVVVGC